MTFRSDVRPMEQEGPHSNVRAEAANRAVAALTVADALHSRALRNRWRRVAGNVPVPRHVTWYSPA